MIHSNYLHAELKMMISLVIPQKTTYDDTSQLYIDAFLSTESNIGSRLEQCKNSHTKSTHRMLSK